MESTMTAIKCHHKVYLSAVRGRSHLFVEWSQVLSQSLEFTLHHALKALVPQLKLPWYAGAGKLTSVVVDAPRAAKWEWTSLTIHVPALTCAVSSTTNTRVTMRLSIWRINVEVFEKLIVQLLTQKRKSWNTKLCTIQLCNRWYQQLIFSAALLRLITILLPKPCAVREWKIRLTTNWPSR